eukprot:2634055-Amphidinium_carterae.1
MGLMGEAVLLQDRASEALQCFDIAQSILRALATSSPEELSLATLLRAEALCHLGQFKESKQVLDGMQDFPPGVAARYFDVLGRVLEELQDFRAACDAFDKSIASPDDVSQLAATLARKGRVLCKERKQEEGVKCIHEAVLKLEEVVKKDAPPGSP